MENENNLNPGSRSKREMSIPTAIILAGALIMVGIIASRGGTAAPRPVKTLSEQVGVSKTSLDQCIKDADLEAIDARIGESVDKAMSAYAVNERGTPYSIIIGPNGFMTDIRGAETASDASLIVGAAKEGRLAQSGGKNLTEIYKGDVVLTEPTDHIRGNPSAEVTIIEYSDFECPYCKQFHPVLENLVKESNGGVRWIYRHYPLHQHSFEKLVAADCVAQIKGDDAFWKYSDLLFGLLKTGNESVSEQL